MDQSKDNDIERIKSSFESSNSTAPNFIWENLDKQLYVDRVWMKIKVRLDTIQLYRRRTIVFAYSVCALLILLVGSWFFLEWNGRTTNQTAKENIRKSSLAETKVKNRSSHKLIFTSSKQSAINKPEKHMTTTLPFLNHHFKADAKSNLYITTTNDSLKEKNLYANITNQDFIEISKSSIDALPDTIYRLDFMQIKLPKSNNDSTLPISYITIPVDSTIPYPKTKNSKNEIGLIYAMSNTILINNDFEESYREGSTVSLVPTFASSYGLIYNHKFSKSNALSLELFVISNQNQHSYLYVNGKYYKKAIESVYSKAVLLYQKNFHFGRMKPCNTYFVKGGGYYSLLTKNSTYLVHNNKKTDIPISIISNMDYGVKLSIGKEIELNKIIIGGGIQSDYGLKNIFLGDSYIPSNFNRTNNFSYGLFLNIKQKL